jgi:hypothetical protein
MYINAENPFGTDVFTPPAPAPIKVKRHKLPKTKRGTRALRNPTMPSTVLKNILLTW